MTDKKTDTKDTAKKTLSLGGTLGLKGGAPAMKSRSGGSVTVEVKRKRATPTLGGIGANKKGSDFKEEKISGLTQHEQKAREAALKAAKEQEVIDAQKREEEAKTSTENAANKPETVESQETETEQTKATPLLSQRERELLELKKITQEEDKKKAEAEAERKKREVELAAAAPSAPTKTSTPTRKFSSPDAAKKTAQEEEKDRKKKNAPRGGNDWHGGRLTIGQALNYEYEVERRQSSMARRSKGKNKNKMMEEESREKQIRDVVIPEVITVQELAKRMTEKTGDVVKTLMTMGVMATINQSIDADTAELVVTEFGHNFKRVTEADVENVIEDREDSAENLVTRAPVVTIMGHVDHGKTSILDALRNESVVSGEAGGITQHIGAYQIVRKNGSKISFLDTPGHAAFTEMRARGANVTDIVVLVVASDDSVMPQTIEAIRHAKAAEVPIIVAINKCDLEAANPQRVKEELLQHEVIVEDYSGDVQCIEVSAKAGINLDKLVDAISLQAEMLELKASPTREGRGSVVEAKLDKGRGPIATILVQNGTINVGDIFICGDEWGRIRALVNDQGKNVDQAGPSVPVEILGLNATPNAGDDFVVVKNENEAREISEYRQRKTKELNVAANASTMDQLFAQAKRSDVKVLPIVLKADVQGSVEAIAGSLKKLTEEHEEELDIKILHSAVGEITEADVTLANASGAVIVAFNVRANAQAREKAKQEGREIRYYSIIYNIIDDIKALLSGLLAPTLQENFIGYAEIRQVFNITKVGKIAGCMVTDGIVKRGAKVRLLRDNVVIHEGTLKTLKRLKDEVKEVREGMECGMAFENYDDIKDKDMIECFEIEEIAREIK